MNKLFSSSIFSCILRRTGELAIAGAVLFATTLPAYSQTVGRSFLNYRVRDVAQLEDTPLGAIAIRASEPNALYFRTTEGGGEENKIYKIALTRGADNRIASVTGANQFVANSPSANTLVGSSDGSLVFAPNGTIIYTSLNDSTLQQIKPGSTSPDRIIEGDEIETFFGGGLVVVPAGFPGAGRLKILSGSWRDALLVPDGEGTYDIQPQAEAIDVQKGFLGAGFVQAGKEGFPKASVVIMDDQGDQIHAYELDSNGDIIPSTAKPFITSISNGTGVTIDPSTGEILFTVGNRILAAGVFQVVKPVVRLTSPENGSVFSNQSTVSLAAEASQEGGAIAGVDFYVNSTRYPAERDNPWSAGVGPLAAGQYSLVAVARDSSGLSSTSSVVNITITNVLNVLPTVRISKPVQNQNYAQCDSIVIRADANDLEDSELTVEFFNGSTLLGRDTTAPYDFIISNAVPGTYNLKAVAKDRDNGSATSSEIVVTVTGPAPNHAVAVLDPISNLFCLCYNGEAGNSYVIEAKPELNSAAQWSPISTNKAIEGSLIKYTDPQSQTGKRFFRVRKGE